MVHELAETTSFSFWGAIVRVRSNREDAEDLRFFYGRYLTDADERAAVDVALECVQWPSRGFLRSSLANDRLRKRMVLDDLQEPARSMESSFTDWSAAASPLPPFASSALAERTATYPGAVVRGPNGTVLALLGSHYSGKTSTALALCRDHGAELISDSLIVLDTESSEALTFETPLGFRRRSLDAIIPWIDRTPHRETVSVDTGLVVLVRPVDYLGRSNADGGRIDHVIHLGVTENHMRWRRTAPPQVGWFTEASEERVARLLPDDLFHLDAPLSTPAASRADVIAQAFFEEHID